jgi:integrase/recombinase XerD
MSDLGATPLETLTAEFVATLGDPRRQASTARAYRDNLRQLCAIVADEGVRTLEGLTRSVLGRWVRALATRGYASETIRRRVFAVQAFFRYLQAEREWPLNPAERLPRPKRIEPLPKEYDRSTAQAILNAVPTRTRPDLRNRALIGIWLYAGLRIAETLSLTWADILGAQRQIRLPRGKGGQGRTVSYGHELEGLLETWRAVSPGIGPVDPVFVGRCGGRMDAKAVYAMLRQYGLYQRWGFTPHRGRHTHLTELLRRGTNLRVIESRAGHRDLRSSMVYLRVFDDDERRAGDALDNHETSPPPVVAASTPSRVLESAGTAHAGGHVSPASAGRRSLLSC